MKISHLTSLLFLSLFSCVSHAAEVSNFDEKTLAHDANIALAQKDYATAFTKFSTLSEHGVASAQFNLGAFYLNGQGVQKDEKLAYEWFQKSAAQGNSRAQQVIENAAARGNVYAKNELDKLQNKMAAAQPQSQPQPQPQPQPKIQPLGNTRTAKNKSIATEPGMHVAFNLGLTYGGDNIFTATTTTGDNKNVKGGGIIQFGLGGLYQFESAPIALMLSANYHADSVTASNGDLSFHRYPIEALSYYTGIERFRLGGGVRIVNSPEASRTINGTTDKIVFDNATGYVAELGYQLAQNSWVNFRYVSEKYQGKTHTTTTGTSIPMTGAKPYDGSHFGVNFLFEY